jgi:hypothetical protein
LGRAHRAELRAFITAAARSNDCLRRVIDAHVSLTFGVGALLDVKSGKTIEIEQRTAGRRFWSADDLPFDPTWPKPVFWERGTSARLTSHPASATLIPSGEAP